MIRVKSGIPGVDELLEGGIPQGASVLVAGGPGTGKSIFCLEYLYNGAKVYGEPGVYITLEEGPHTMWWNMQRFKWELLPLERENMLKIYKFEPSVDMKADVDGQVRRIVDKVKELKAKRVVIDSLTSFSFWIEEPAKLRYAMYTLLEELRKLETTTLLTVETAAGKTDFSRFGVEEFLTDGVIALYFIPPHRALFVRKMRGTKHSMKVHPIVIDDRGFTVSPQEEILWEALGD
jgi:KaiC/GvpD/RAD55 family RecA-like ATPase